MMMTNSLLSIAGILATLFPTSPAPLPNLPPAKQVCVVQECVISPGGVNMIASFEGYSPFIYLDSAGLPTIGHGHLIVKGEKFQEPMMPDAAQNLLRKDVVRTEKGVRKLAKGELTQNQYDATISFTFNLGIGTYQASSVREYTNAKRHAEVPDCMRLYVNVRKNGKLVKVNGLVIRREAEASLYALP